MPLGVTLDIDLCVGVTRWQESCYGNHAFAILIKEQSPSTWLWHDNRGRDYRFLEQSRGEVTFHCIRTQPLQWNGKKWDDLSRGFLAIVISSAGSQIRPNERRLALASAVCYSSLTFARWKGSLLLYHIWMKGQYFVCIFSPLAKLFIS